MSKFIRKTKKVNTASNIPKNIRSYVHKAVMRAPEDKYSLVNYGNVACNRATANVCSFYTALTDTIAQGLADNNARVGDEIQATQLHVNFSSQMIKGITTPDDICTFRMVIFQWNDVLDTTGATGAALGAILPTGSIFLTGLGGATNSDPTCHYNHDRVRAKQLVILYDRLWHQENNSNTVGGAFSGLMVGGLLREKRINLKKARKRIHFINNSTTNASGHIFCIVLTNNPVAATNPLGYLSTKLDFIDS